MSEEKKGEAARKDGELPWWRNDPWLGAHLWAENRSKNADLLLPYDGKCVAWFPDGSGIRDADPDMGVLWNRIKASGDDPSWYAYEHVNLEPYY
jgi:hypothetical protein